MKSMMPYGITGLERVNVLFEEWGDKTQLLLQTATLSRGSVKAELRYASGSANILLE